jgi:hypothetical protein
LTPRAELEAAGVTFLGDTFDTGVCRQAIFADPDGNPLVLYHRYARPKPSLTATESLADRASCSCADYSQ